MNENNLLRKANNNCKTAEWAEKKGFFDVSISRYYYCLYEKAIYITIKKDLFAYSADDKDSHIKFIENFQKSLASKLSDREITWLACFGDLRAQRNFADYKLGITDEKQFKLGFKYKYLEIDKILNKLCN